MRILFVGAGAVGGYFGGRLIQAGRDVTFLVRPARAEILRRDGLRILSPHGDALLQPKLVSTGEIDGTYDLVILGVKGYALDDAMRDMAPAVGPATTVLPLLNGMRHIDRLDETFSAEVVIGGVALVATQIDAEGRVVQLADVQQLRYGERDGQTTPRILAIDAALQGPGFDAGLSSSIVQDLWDKWVMLASLGAVTCLFRGPIGAVAAVPGGAELARAILDECAAIATACGYRPSDAYLGRQAETLTAEGSPMTSSMYRDLRQNAPVEVDAILGDLLDLARQHSTATPLLTAAYVNLRVYANARAAH
ncbi:MAG: ketopantoate reductase family protein [Janthinobacterium lividum]